MQDVPEPISQPLNAMSVAISSYSDTGFVTPVTINEPFAPPTLSIPIVSAPARPYPYVERFSPNARPRTVRRERSLDAERAHQVPMVWPMTVSALLLVAGALGAGLVMLQAHPAWFTGLRNSDVAHVAAPTIVSSGTAHGIERTAATSSSVTYRVSAPSYSVVIANANRDWVVVRSPATTGRTLLATTLPVSSTPHSVVVHGSASVTMAASTRSLTIMNGSSVLGVIDSPVVGRTYIFTS